MSKSTIGPAITRWRIGPRIKIHWIHSPDKAYHTHPWNGISFICGSYYESHEDNPYKWYKRRFINRIYAHRAHMVIPPKPVWTLFIHGPRINENWRYGSTVRPWNGADSARSGDAHETAKHIGIYIPGIGRITSEAGFSRLIDLLKQQGGQDMLRHFTILRVLGLIIVRKR